MFVASDYGGEHSEALWTTYTFVLSDLAEAARWTMSIKDVRAEFLSDGRRLAYKRLADRVRLKALLPFLERANSYDSLLVCFVVNREIKSLFGRGKLDPLMLNFEPLRNWPVPVVEKMLVITHLLALLVAGMSKSGQDLLWVTDEDPIAPNPHGLQTLTEVAGRATASLLPHPMRHFRVATAKSDPGDKSLEDVLAIPDLVSGAISEMMKGMFGRGGPPTAPLYLPRAKDVPPKVRTLGDWFADNTQSLKRLVIAVDETENGSLRATHLRFHGTRDLGNGGVI